MTVSYQYDVASSASGGFIRLLFRWKGSVWKVVYREMLIFTLCYIALTILYNFVLTEVQQKIFEKVVYFCSTFMDLIPLSFMLGFYVSFIAARWWSQFIAIPWPDKLMNIVAMYIPGLDESSRVVRRTLMRYLNLSLVLVLRSISMAVKRRFPTKEHLIEAGFMTKTELEMFQSVPSTEFNTFWIPCTWFINVLREARQECRITDSNGLKLIMEELNEFRSKCGLLWGYDWISIPLVYTQVVTMATYAFYVACMFGRQNVNIISEKPSSPEVHRYDFYIPIFTVLQLMFYMGLLKVAEQLINPFGDDDEDFELNWIIDRHMKVSYLGVDTLNGTPPPLVRDTYYNELDVKIPYTEASKGYKKKTYRGSVAYMQVPMEQQGMVVPDMSEEEDDGETQVDTMGHRRPSMYSLFQSQRGSHSKGMSPSVSFTNLDKESVSSVDSEWKRSLPDLTKMGAKNASGTLGHNQDPTPVVDMATAEDDEIILQEVIVEQNNIRPPTVARSDSLQIPGTTGYAPSEKQTSRFTKLRSRSPKIAPKFPREKLKSMFRKRKLSTAMIFHKLRGVRFSRDTKEEDESENESLLNGEHEPLEVSITLSTPELTEIEKKTGVHPYYFTQQAIISGKQLVPSRAFPVRQASLTRSESEEENISKGLKVAKQIPRSSSLPNIQQSDASVPYVSDPVIVTALKKILKVKKPKGTAHKRKRKKKSPPPESRRASAAEPPGHAAHTDPGNLEYSSDNDLSIRRNTLPQIILTRCGPKAPEHLDLAVSPTHSSQSSSQSSDSGAQGSTTSMASKPAPKTVPCIQTPEAQPTEKSTTLAKSSDLHSKHKKDTSTSTKPKAKSTKDEEQPLKRETEDPPKLPPRMPISGVKALPEKTAVEEVQEPHSKLKETSPPYTKFKVPTVSKEEPIKPSQPVTLQQGSSLSISEAPSPEVIGKKMVSAKESELHSKPATAPPKPVTFETTTWKEEAAKKSQLRRKSPPPPKRSSPPPPKKSSPPPPKRSSPPPPTRSSPPPSKISSAPPPTRPETLLLAAKIPSLLSKRGSISAKKIAGISLAATVPKQQTPESPTADIPSPYATGKLSSLPQPAIKLSEPSSSISSHAPDIPTPTKDIRTFSYPKPVIKTSPQSPTEEGARSLEQVSKARADTVVKIYDSQEDLQGMEEEKSPESTRPPDAPKRHLPRQSSRAKK